MGSKGGPAMRVALFVTCLVDNLFPDVGEAMVRILHRLGVETVLPEAQTCCGQPAFNSGYADEARAAAKTLLRAFADAEYVVAPSGSCTGMIHHYYPSLFAGDPAAQAEAESLAQRTYEFSQFLVKVLGVTDLGAEFPHRVTYHPSCHGARLLGVQDEPVRLLRAVRGLELVDLPHAQDCCGFGGTFSVKMGDISAAMVDEKVDHVRETGAHVLVGTDMGCLMNIGGRLRRRGEPVRVLHLAELLWEGMQHRGGGAA
jgi:L-lactate dehydrogenase complex protein LldE